MRLIYFLTIFLFSVSCKNAIIENPVTGSVKNKPGIEFKLVQKGALSDFSDTRGVNNYYNVEFRLINHSESDLEFFTMSCASLITIVTDEKDGVTFLNHNCASNYGTIIKLKQNQEYSLPAVFISNKYNTMRFGFVLNRVKYKKGLKKNGFLITEDPIVALLKMRENLENVIWTENITLRQTSFKPFEIRNIINDSTYSIVHER